MPSLGLRNPTSREIFAQSHWEWWATILTAAERAPCAEAREYRSRRHDWSYSHWESRWTTAWLQYGGNSNTHSTVWKQQITNDTHRLILFTPSTKPCKNKTTLFRKSLCISWNYKGQPGNPHHQIQESD